MIGSPLPPPCTALIYRLAFHEFRSSTIRALAGWSWVLFDFHCIHRFISHLLYPVFQNNYVKEIIFLCCLLDFDAVLVFPYIYRRLEEEQPNLSKSVLHFHQ